MVTQPRELQEKEDFSLRKCSSFFLKQNPETVWVGITYFPALKAGLEAQMSEERIQIDFRRQNAFVY